MLDKQTATPKLRWFHPTPGRLLIILLAVEGMLLLSERGRGLPKGWAVLMAVAAVIATMVLILLWYFLALIFHRRFQFRIRSLLLLTVAVAIPSSWLTMEMRRAGEQKEAVEALIKVKAAVGGEKWGQNYLPLAKWGVMG